MLKYENVSLLLIILYMIYDLLTIIYNVLIRYGTLTYYGIITTIIEISLLYNMTKRLITIIKKEEVSYSDKKN